MIAGELGGAFRQNSSPRRVRDGWLLCFMAGIACSCTAQPPDGSTASATTSTPGPACGSGICLADVTSQAGIAFEHTDGQTGHGYIVEYVSAGLALLDYDGDGRLDIYFLNGGQLPGSAGSGTPRDALYRNEGGWRFTDVTAAAGVGDPGHGLGVAAADFDNDGDQDLYLNNFGPNVLLENNGDGTFTPVEDRAGVADGERVGAGTCFLDIEGDGDLDLFAANYVQFRYETHRQRTYRGVPVFPSPLDHPPETDTLFRNEGDGTFADVSQESGIAACAGPGMGAICFDFDEDRDTDIYVCNDLHANFLFRNDGGGQFQEIGLLAGVGLDFQGIEQGSMGAACGDYNRDGRLDLLITNFQNEMPTLYRNSGRGFFEDVTAATGAGAPAVNTVTWGVGLVDLDDDADLDIYIASGHLMETVEQQDSSQRYATRDFVLMNRDGEKFLDVSNEAGDGLAVAKVGRGAVFGDLDDDGDVDVVVLNVRSLPTVLRNESVHKRHWVQIRLRGRQTNAGGVGARVEVQSGDQQLVQEVHSGASYQSHNGLHLHFGLGQVQSIDRVTVHWIGGGTDVFENVPIDRCVTLIEGVSRPVVLGGR